MVPTQTEFAAALAQPFNVIESIIKRRDGKPQPTSQPTDSDVVAHFRSLFHDQDRTAKIPALTPGSLPALLENASTAPQSEAKLVRWRCMIQDTGFASEVYQSYQLDEDASTSDASASNQGAGSVTYSAFGLDFTVPDAPVSADAGQAGSSSSDSSIAGASTSSSAQKARAQQRRETESLRERNVMYAVSVPGETAWARRAYGDANVKDDLSGSVAALRLNTTSTAPRASTSSANPFSYKSPIPEERHVSGMLKFYDVDGASASLQVTQVIEAVGILESTPFRADDWQDLGFGGPSSAQQGGASATVYNGPCLHVLFFTPLPPSTIPQALTEARTPSLTGLASAPEIRAGLLAYLTQALDGDELAAEFLLLALLARVHSRRNPGGGDASGEAGADAGAEGAGIGGLSLNLSGVPEDGPAPAPAPNASKEANTAPQIPEPPLPKLRQALQNLLPAVVDQPLALPHLNAPDVTLAPRAGAHAGSSIDSGESLQAGRLQLPRGTLVLVDEVGMGDGGKLNEGGVRNLQALSGLLRTHRLEYEYPYNRFAFEADLRVVVLSAGKSFLPVDVHLPLQLQAGGKRGDKTAAAAAAAEKELPELAPDTLRLYRLHLLQARHAAFTIDENDGVAERISADFVEARKRAASAKSSGSGGVPTTQPEGSNEATSLTTQEDLLRRMSIARLLALSRSEHKLSVDTWVRAGELDEARLERVRKLPLGRPVASQA
ncbi:hypothetical protein OC834_002181 [Tilletia horrida]|nr:hypothetical protein OC834_002181 [Tilletia horrida]